MPPDTILSPQRGDLRLEIGRDLAVEVVERGERHAPVGQRALVVPAGKVWPPALALNVSSTAASIFFSDEVMMAAAYSGSDSAWSVSTPIAQRPLDSMYLIDTLPVAPATGATMSAPWSAKRLGQLLALGGVAPRVAATHERAPLARRVPAEQADMRALLLVVVGDAGVVAVHEPGHARVLLAAVGADLARLAEPRGEVAGEHRGLVDLEVEAREVRPAPAPLAVSSQVVSTCANFDVRVGEGRVWIVACVCSNPTVMIVSQPWSISSSMLLA